MQKVITKPEIELPIEKNPRETLEIWERAFGIWKKKKMEPIQYLKRIRKEWERKK